jgi:UDP-N-acetylmuramyl pentapeptide phosphotransferase/UDP-N-acetylglucosamine-1-phosphate transferase
MKNEPNFLYIITLLTSFLFSLILTPLIRRLAVKEGFIVRPRDDRWSKKPTALLGGVGIFSSLITVWLTAAIMINFKAAFSPLLPLAIGGAAVFLLGLIDDLFEISPQHKLVGQIIIASVLVIFGFQVNWFNSATANQIISIFWIVGITNAFNLLDNMDGLSAGIAFIAGLFFFCLRYFPDAAVPCLPSFSCLHTLAPWEDF